jgi:ATP-binding cassette, subfamily B, multidrug efflux pump
VTSSSTTNPESAPVTLLGQFRARVDRYTVGLLLLLAYQAMQYWFDTRLMHAIDAARRGDLATARFIALLLVGVAVAALGVRTGSRIVIFYAGRDAEYSLRKALLEKLYGLGPSFYATAGTGDLMSRATNDLTQVRLLLGFGVLNVMNTVLALTSSLAVMFSISTRLTLASMVSLPLLVWVTRGFAKRIFARTRENQVALGAMSNTVQSSLSAVRVVRAYGLEGIEAERFEADNTLVLERGLDLARLRGLMGPLMQAISAIGVVIVFWYGGWLLIDQHLSAGGLLAFVRASTRLTWPLIALGFLVSMVQRGRAAHQRLLEVFETRSEIESTPCESESSGVDLLEVRGLTYRIDDRDVLRDVNLAIQPGERVAIVGPTGAGKSTLARLLSRALPAPHGTVYLGGREISTVPLSDVRRRICYSQQSPFLFSSTVAQNLAFALPETESEAARRASIEVAQSVRIDAEIRQLVHGYDTVVGERGIQLSGGQRQRIALGRALLSTSQVVVLDDPTSAVDVGTERALCELFTELGRERTLVIITHRVSLAARCDRVIVLDAGRIVQTGAPSELEQETGLYRRFCEEQRLESELDGGPETRESSSSPSVGSVTDATGEVDRGLERDAAMREYHEEAVFASAFNPRLYRDLIGALTGERAYLGLAAIAVAVTALLGLLRPLFVRTAIDAAVMRSDAERLAQMGLVVAVLAVGEQLLGFTQSYLTQLSGARALARLRAKLFAFLHRMPIGFFDQQPVGRLTTRVTNDVDAIQELFSSGILAALGDLLRLVGIVALMISVDARLSLAAFASAPLVVVVVLTLRRPMRGAFRTIRSQTARMNSALNEQISGMAVVQAFDKMQRAGREFDSINRAYRDAHLKAIRYEAVQDAALETIASIALASMVFVFGATNASFGTLLAFQMYLGQFFEPLSQLTQRYTLLQSAMAGAERAFGLLAREQRDAPVRAVATVVESKPQSTPPSTGQAIVFEDVEFSYNPGVPVLHRLGFSVGIGEHLALVGPTGSGKSTIASLLIRLYEPNGGQIRVMGKSIDEFDVATLRRQFAVVPQDPWLFPGTLLNNIAGSDSVDRERARAVLKRMNALEHFERRLGGLDRVVGSSGGEYSVGERQLVAFARALYRDAPILLLDEATASIDSETELCLQRALEGSLLDRTAVVIAHRLSTIRLADRILVLQRGRLVEAGTHRELIEADGLYRRLVALSSVRTGVSALTVKQIPAA